MGTSAKPADAPARMRVAAVCVLAMVVLPWHAVTAQEKTVRAEFPVDLASAPVAMGFPGVPDPSYVPAFPEGRAGDAVMMEARWTFAGMVWGFTYTYTPLDRTRGLEERFDAVARAPGAGLSVRPVPERVRMDGLALFATVRWTPDAQSSAEMGAWKKAGAVSQGSGTAPAFVRPSGTAGLIPSPGGTGTTIPSTGNPGGATGPVATAGSAPARSDSPETDTPWQVQSRRDAILDATRAAVREYLRGITHNKPREVRGTVAFASPPRVYLKSGAWVAHVRVYMTVDEILDYGGY